MGRHAAPGAAPPATPQHPAVCTVLVTEQGGAVSHLVTDDQVCAPVHGHDPRAVCGRTFLPAGLTTPIGRICDACWEIASPPSRPSGRRGLKRWRR